MWIIIFSGEFMIPQLIPAEPDYVTQLLQNHWEILGIEDKVKEIKFYKVNDGVWFYVQFAPYPFFRW